MRKIQHILRFMVWLFLPPALSVKGLARSILKRHANLGEQVCNLSATSIALAMALPLPSSIGPTPAIAVKETSRSERNEYFVLAPSSVSIPSQSMEGLGSVEAVVLAGNTDGQAAAIPLREYGKTITPDTWNANSCSENKLQGLCKTHNHL